MYELISNLILYGNLPEDEILVQLAKLLSDDEKSNHELRQEIYGQIKRLLELATQYGFNDNLWHNYLTYLLMTNENPFSMTCEKQGAREGTVNHFALNDLVGYEIQKKKLLDNTVAFVEGRKANNVLLYGDSGTGKSTSIKAIVNEFYDQGLRMIEIYKHQFKDLSNIIAMIKNRNYRFIIYMDDLSFEEFEIEYKFLKAVIEGGVETKPENILIYATSNRRHLIKENWSDRNDVVQENGMHQSDTMEEKLSLVNRFGVKINYSKPMKKEFNHIVLELAHKNNIEMDEKELLLEANKWELSHGGTSGRTAQQFINYILGLER